MLTIPGAAATEKADRASVVFLPQAGLCRKVAHRKVFVYLKNTFWTKRRQTESSSEQEENLLLGTAFSAFIILSELKKVVNW